MQKYQGNTMEYQVLHDMSFSVLRDASRLWRVMMGDVMICVNVNANVNGGIRFQEGLAFCRNPFRRRSSFRNTRNHISPRFEICGLAGDVMIGVNVNANVNDGIRF